MALRFEDVYRAELAEIRKRRLHQWRAEEIRREKIRREKLGEAGEVPARSAAEQPPPEQRDRVFEGIPAASPPEADGAAESLAFNEILDDLESSRLSFLEEQRREAARRQKQRADGETPSSSDTGAEAGPAVGPSQDRHYGLTGLALSGGGVRSSTFCLGAIQALAKRGVYSKLDYLSTVSGGGFIGSCLSSLHADGSTEFPFDHEPGVPEGQPLRHLRNHANYLAPRGLVDYLKVPGLLLRGILVNFLIILPYVLLAAVATALIAGPRVRMAAQVATKPVPESGAEAWADAGRDIILSGAFTYTGGFVIGFLALLVVYPIVQTLGNALGLTSWERRNRGNALLGFGITLAFCIAALEAQPIAVYYSVLLWFNPAIRGDIISLDVLIGVFSVIAGLGATVSGKLAPQANRLAAKVALFGIGFLGPLVLWLVYLMLTRWAICGPPGWTSALAKLAEFSPWPVSGEMCIGTSFGTDREAMTRSVAAVFTAVAAGIWLYGYCFINANRNSLHAYYRDRLSRAFLFKRSRPEIITDREPGPAAKQVVHNDKQLLQELRGREPGLSPPGRWMSIRKQLRQVSWRAPQKFFSALIMAKSSATAELHIAPYHLINATINVRRPRTQFVEVGDKPLDGAGRKADVHGRKADFFLFSRSYIGSKVTNYCRTENMHDVDRHVDLGTAMAISGAAAAPNMGTSTVRPLVFILTLLNVRLGYWLPNPNTVHQRFNPEAKSPAQEGSANWFRQMWEGFRRAWKNFLNKALLTARVGPLYLLFEMFGLLNQEWPFINVSDGGHIENLGLYPLLQRRCRLIIVIDGERDPANEKEGHRFSALATAIRYARIDHGIDIEIDLEKVGRKDGKHFAVGKITYGQDLPHGRLVYVKSSLTGDENPYIREYSLKNPSFPHESTGDQFFDETQFECYRALGHHAVDDFLDRAAGGKTGNQDLQAPPHPANKTPRRTIRRKSGAMTAPPDTDAKP